MVVGSCPVAVGCSLMVKSCTTIVTNSCQGENVSSLFLSSHDRINAFGRHRPLGSAGCCSNSSCWRSPMLCGVGVDCDMGGSGASHGTPPMKEPTTTSPNTTGMYQIMPHMPSIL